jgi:hypothetical protein
MTDNRIFSELLTDPSAYDALEVHGVRNWYPPDAEEGTCCEIDDTDPEFFSVYAHLRAGGCECVGDFDLMGWAVIEAHKLGAAHGWPTRNYVTDGKYWSVRG